MTTINKSIRFFLIPLITFHFSLLTSHAQQQVDVCVYGATPAGIMAACAAKSEGKSVMLIEPGQRIGGMTAGGLGWTDLYHPDMLKGYARQFYERVAAYYGETGMKLTFEPRVALSIFKRFLSDAGVDNVMMGHRLVSVEKADNRITAITLEAADPSQLKVAAKVFLDCSYEGDLMARAGVSYTIGREPNSKYGETGNGVQLREKHQFPDGVDPYVVKGDPSSGLLWGISPDPVGINGEGDNHVQAYNFRLTLTRNAANRIPITDEVPDNYDPSRYELLIRLKEKSPWTSYEDCLKWSIMPNDKCDMNNQGAFSTDMIGESYNYPEATYEERAAIYKRHLDYTKGLLYFMWTDPRIPANIRNDLAQWGWPRDEYEDNNHITPQLYIRESRRMLGRMVMTQAECERTVEVDDPIGYGDYTMDSHNCGRYVVNGMVKNEGDVQIYLTKGPYGISYRAVTPKQEEACNLIVPVCLSASHIAFGSIRMEPVYMMLGESCALAACDAIDNYDACVQEVVASEVMEKFEERAAEQDQPDDSSSEALLLEYIDQQHRPVFEQGTTDEPTLSVDLTDRLLVNPGFELFAEDGQLRHFSGEADQVAAQGVPFGWQQHPSEFAGMTRGIYSATQIAGSPDDLGNGVYVCNQENFPTGFTLSQTIPAGQLMSGTYKVSCLMWIEKDKYGGACLFANDNAQYWTASGYYQSNGLTATDNEVSFADYGGGAPTVKHMRPMVVYVNVGEGEDLTLGIRTNSVNNGTTTANAGHFIVDNFRVERVVTSPDLNPSEFSEAVLVNNDFELNPDGTVMAAGNRNTWKLVGRDISKVLGWSQNYTTDNYGITDGKCTNLFGKWSYWLNSKSKPIPNDFRFWQTADPQLMEPGIYEVSCRMWQQRGMLGKARLFADNGQSRSVMYYGAEENYAGVLDPDEQTAFAGYSGSGTDQRNYNEMYVRTTVEEGQTLNVGVMSGYGADNRNEEGLFHVDFFRVWKHSNLPVTFRANEANSLSGEMPQRRVTLDKSFPKDQWITLCLPFNMSKEDLLQVFGPESRLMKPTGMDGEKIFFSACTTIEAGQPYLLYASHPLPSPLTIADVDILASQPATLTFDGGLYTLVGTYDAYNADATHRALDDHGGEAFGFYALGTTNAPEPILIINDPTKIDPQAPLPPSSFISHPSSIYDLQGRKVADNPTSLILHPFSKKGLYIVDGNKIAVK